MRRSLPRVWRRLIPLRGRCIQAGFPCWMRSGPTPRDGNCWPFCASGWMPGPSSIHRTRFGRWRRCHQTRCASSSWGRTPITVPARPRALRFRLHRASGFPSLHNIFQELQRDLGLPAPVDGSLVRWSRQGVLLLNTCLTVEDAQPAGHAGQGWEVLTDRVIRHCLQTGHAKAFLLWGGHAQKKAAAVDEQRHLLLCANHPSPLSARRGPLPFLGCGHFSAVNRWLQEQGRISVEW